MFKAIKNLISKKEKEAESAKEFMKVIDSITDEAIKDLEESIKIVNKVSANK